MIQTCMLSYIGTSSSICERLLFRKSWHCLSAYGEKHKDLPVRLLLCPPTHLLTTVDSVMTLTSAYKGYDATISKSSRL